MYSCEKTEDSQPLSKSSANGTRTSHTSSFTRGVDNFSLAPEVSKTVELSITKYEDELENKYKTYNSTLENVLMTRAKVDKLKSEMSEELERYSPDWKVQSKEREMFRHFRKYQKQGGAVKKYGSTFEEFKAKFENDEELMRRFIE